MLILFNATASFYERCSFFFLMRQPLFTNTILFSLMRQPLFTNTVLLLFFFPAQRTGSSQIFSVLTLRKSARPSSACLSASAKSPIFAPTQV